jgi:ABC-2 type transport system permease protein
MHNFLALVKVNLKNTFSMTDGKQKKSALNRFLPVFILIALLPSIASMYFLTQDLIGILTPIQQTGIVVALLLMGVSVTVFFFAIFLVPSVYYFSKDVETLLALPLQPWVIVASKFVVTVIYEYFTLFFFALPVLAAYIVKVQPPVAFYPILLVVLVLLPVVPLIFASILIMLIMWLVPFAKNRDFFNYLSTFFALGLALGINFLAGSAATVSQDVLIDLLMRGNNSLTSVFNLFIPNIRFAVEALVKISLLDTLIYVGIVILASVAFVALAQIVYFRGAIGVNETSANRKRLKGKAYSKSTVSGNVILTYTLKELKLLFRTPIYLMNCVLSAVLIPGIMIASFSMQLGDTSELQQIIDSIPWGSPQLSLYILAGGAAFGWVITSLNLITPTAISREGQNAYFMKYIPMSYFAQMSAKVLSGMAISLLGIVCFILPVAWFIKLPLNLTIIAFAASVLTSVFMNYLGMIVDILHPKLVWEQEASAVKQNLNAVFTMVPAAGLSFGIFFLIGKLPTAGWVSLLIFLILIGLDFLLVYLTKRVAEKAMPRMLG